MFSTFSLDNPATWTGLIMPVLGAIAAVLLGFVIGRGAQHAVMRWVPRTNSMATIAPLAGQAARYGILVFAIVTALGFLGVPQASIIAVVGAASLRPWARAIDRDIWVRIVPNEITGRRIP